MKWLLRSWLILMIGMPVLAQQRLITHLTQENGSFVSTLILANYEDLQQAYGFTAYDAAGNKLADANGTLAGGATQTVSAADLFGVSGVSHISINNETSVQVSISYRANREGSGPAHVNEAGQQATAWRIYSGNPAVTWDGMALVNTGGEAARVRVDHLNASGGLIKSETVFEALAPMAKGLYVFSTGFQPQAGSYFEIFSSQQTAVLALRGVPDSNFLWQNSAQHFTPGLAKTRFSQENAFPNLFFNGPIDLQDPMDGSNRLFVATKRGQILVFENNRDTREATEFLDVTDLITIGPEMGLLGFAFHPRYAENGTFFVNYTTERNGPRRTVIAKYQVNAANPNQANANSHTVILEVNQPQGNHNAGQLAFGPDGYLYIGLGDGGGANDMTEQGQNLQTMLGSMLRIDVDQSSGSRAYGIPADNPYVGNNNGIPEETYAHGLRNPWRYSFDTTPDGTVRLWLGDVGQDNFEEISIVEKGLNYGWNTMEGFNCFDPALNCDMEGLTLPVWDYGHLQGDKSVTGGWVYRGTRMPALYGAYVYGDFVSGRIWALRYDGTNPPFNKLLLDENDQRLPAAFGTSQNGELYMVSLAGLIYRFVQEGP